MQGSFQEMLNPDHDCYSETGISPDFYEQLKLAGDLQDDEEEPAEEEFSFMVGGESTPVVAAADAFMDGQIKPLFPLFNRNLLFSGDGDSNSLPESLPLKSPVNRAFVETNEAGKVTSSRPENDQIAGPYCEWSSRKAVAVAPPPEVCKKSNSTGFSKNYRKKECVWRCNSDGRDASVSLNHGHATPTAAATKAEEKREKKETTAVQTNAAKKSEKSKTAPLSSLEVYLRNKAKEKDRRRTYLPYR